MKISASFTSITNTIRTFLWRYNLTVFLVLSIGAISVATLLLYQAVLSAGAPASNETTNTITFDKDTMDRVKKLEPATSLDTYSLPKNQRSNPFTE